MNYIWNNKTFRQFVTRIGEDEERQEEENDIFAELEDVAAHIFQLYESEENEDINNIYFDSNEFTTPIDEFGHTSEFLSGLMESDAT